MKKLAVFICIFFMLMHSEASASWAYPFVVYDNSIYAVTMEQVSSDLLGERIGKVTRFSDREGTYRGHFSNSYPKGTAYYAINGISPKQQIAVQAEKALYLKALYQGEYAASGPANNMFVWIGMAGVAAAAIVVFVLYRRNRAT
ncbi:hypothetical protein GRF59_11530 [Paenibacillus sp. HJL G12]|uniref:Uncharacterized protein n=1 Tax=Paenibacillus dendrobii TaxID=2691084 RepID=A0A7X3IHX8_9BACL|nr:hypothetical protein [Paenibacillus dendrobii]MWV44264.1 hypothetical protein [Paenibacillus dendrobii]